MLYNFIVQPANMVIQSASLLAMEDLPINNNNGQSYGFIHYRNVARLRDGDHQIETVGHVRDLAIFMVDGKTLTDPWVSDVQLRQFGYWSLP